MDSKFCIGVQAQTLREVEGQVKILWPRSSTRSTQDAPLVQTKNLRAPVSRTGSHRRPRKNVYADSGVLPRVCHGTQHISIFLIATEIENTETLDLFPTPDVQPRECDTLPKHRATNQVNFKKSDTEFRPLCRDFKFLCCVFACLSLVRQVMAANVDRRKRKCGYPGHRQMIILKSRKSTHLVNVCMSKHTKQQMLTFSFSILLILLSKSTSRVPWRRSAAEFALSKESILLICRRQILDER